MKIDYYFTPISPWTYLGHQRFTAMARAAGAEVNVMPVDYGVIFPASGGLPLPKRAPQRQAYRLVELKRFSTWLEIPLNPTPRFFPVDAAPSARLVVQAAAAGGAGPALRLAGAMGRALWAEERDLADAATLAALLAEQGLPAGWLAGSNDPSVAARFEANTRQALAAGVFGAPSYVVDGEIFWGQDRLEFLQRRLAATV